MIYQAPSILNSNVCWVCTTTIEKFQIEICNYNQHFTHFLPPLHNTLVISRGGNTPVCTHYSYHPIMQYTVQVKHGTAMHITFDMLVLLIHSPFTASYLRTKDLWNVSDDDIKPKVEY